MLVIGQDRKALGLDPFLFKEVFHVRITK
jgi:hypothetical protein